ncbi:hypothetical protein NHQ30_008902 [Ciborinia camelliae]|nr:hypothetical protein NHQ30_008902 [Ciborinia camelliae]
MIRTIHKYVFKPASQVSATLMKYQKLPNSEEAEMANEINNNERASSTETFAEPDGKYGTVDNNYISRSEVESLNFETAIPPGTIDPIYEAKACVLNEAVRSNNSILSESSGQHYDH